MNQNPIQELMGTTMNSIKNMVDVDTIIGEAYTSPDGTVIIPVSKASFGFVSGGSEFTTKDMKDDKPFGGGAGAGVSIQPIAFIVIQDGNVKLMQINENNNSLDKVVSLIPDLVDKAKDLFKKED